MPWIYGQGKGRKEGLNVSSNSPSHRLPGGHTDKGTVERGIERELSEPPDFHIFLLSESATFPRMFSSFARRV